MPFVVAAGVTLPLGFLVAEVTGIRAIGGLVVLAGLVACGVLARRAGVGLPASGAVIAVALVAFAVAHPLGRAVPPSVAVLLAGLAVAGAAVLALHRATRRSGTVA